MQTAAYNLPNDERVVQQKGSKRVMLKNVQEAKFSTMLIPIAGARARRRPRRTTELRLVLHAHPGARAHPRDRPAPDHRWAAARPRSRQELKELYSAIEEAKADVTGLFMLQYMYDHKLLQGDLRAPLYHLPRLHVPHAALRPERGARQRHGAAVQLPHGQAGHRREQGRDLLGVNMANVRRAVRDLTNTLLTLEATGNYAGAKAMLEGSAALRPQLQTALAGLEDIPVDIDPIPVTANQLAK